ncbi:MAG: hypothetical protein ACRD68_14430 [Pyrinomonadaceae bacterium]
MSSKLTVIFYIVLCLEAGLVLTLLPWMHPFGMSDWGDNYFLLYASQKIGIYGLKDAVSSGWVRGAVTGLGVLNLGMAFWEMAHFRQTVRKLQAQEDAPAHATRPRTADDLPDYERRDDAQDHPGR